MKISRSMQWLDKIMTINSFSIRIHKYICIFIQHYNYLLSTGYGAAECRAGSHFVSSYCYYWFVVVCKFFFNLIK